MEDFEEEVVDVVVVDFEMDLVVAAVVVVVVALIAIIKTR
jgi:hypothetical protein